MQQPQEIEVWYVLPAIRMEMAKAMLSLGIKQKQIARTLGITEPAVSQYLKEKRGKEIELSKGIKEKIKSSVKDIIEKKSSLTKEIQNLCKLIKDKKILCEIHKNYCNLPCNCKECF